MMFKDLSRDAMIVGGIAGTVLFVGFFVCIILGARGAKQTDGGSNVAATELMEQSESGAPS